MIHISDLYQDAKGIYSVCSKAYILLFWKCLKGYTVGQIALYE